MLRSSLWDATGWLFWERTTVLWPVCQGVFSVFYEITSDLNATLTALDQFTNVIMPLLTGVSHLEVDAQGLISQILFTWLGLQSMCIIFGSAALISFVLKTFFLHYLYNHEDELRKDKVRPARSESTAKAEDLSGNIQMNSASNSNVQMAIRNRICARHWRASFRPTTDRQCSLQPWEWPSSS